jgi:hypothetical protein
MPSGVQRITSCLRFTLKSFEPGTVVRSTG